MLVEFYAREVMAQREGTDAMAFNDEEGEESDS